MTKDDLIQMALECDLLDSRDDLDQPAFAEIIAAIERFYHLAVAAEREARSMRWDEYIAKAIAAEREACAEACDELIGDGSSPPDWNQGVLSAIEAIRARSQS